MPLQVNRFIATDVSAARELMDHCKAVDEQVKQIADNIRYFHHKIVDHKVIFCHPTCIPVVVTLFIQGRQLVLLSVHYLVC